MDWTMNFDCSRERDIRSRVLRCGEGFWPYFQRIHKVLINELLENHKNQEGLWGIELSPDRISLSADASFDAENLKPTQAIIIGDAIFNKIGKEMTTAEIREHS